MNTITLRQGEQVWEADYSGPHAAEIKRLFGSTTLPTVFERSTSSVRVAMMIRGQNPGVAVKFAE